MKTARQAAEETYNKIDSAEIQCLTAIETEIDEGINRGNTYMYYYDFIPENAIKKLKELGYSVKDQSSQRDGETYLISWA